MEKPFSEMTEKEILRKQLELLAEKSQSASATELLTLSSAMLNITELALSFEMINLKKNQYERGGHSSQDFLSCTTSAES